MAEEEANPISSVEEKEFNPSKFFGLLLGAGVVSIIVGTYLESLLINLILPVSIMGYYIYEIANKTEETLSIEQRADSVYYMGFIFTLVAMTASLVSLANNDEIAFNSVVINFGLALVTTIIGLAVRIIWLQLDSQNLNDAESLLKDKIIKQTRALGEESDNIITKMTGLSSQMEKAASDLRENFENLTKSFDLSHKVNKNLEELNATAELINESFLNISSTTESLNPEFAQLNTNVKNAVEIPATVNQDLREVGESSNQLISEFNTLSSSAEELEPTIVALSARLAQSVQTVAETIESLQSSMEANNELHLKNRLNLEESMTASQETIQSNNQLLRDNTENLTVGIQRSQDTLELLQASLSETANSIREGNTAIQEAINKSAELLAQRQQIQSEEN